MRTLIAAIAIALATLTTASCRPVDARTEKLLQVAAQVGLESLKVELAEIAKVAKDPAAKALLQEAHDLLTVIDVHTLDGTLDAVAEHAMVRLVALVRAVRSAALTHK